MTNTPAGAPPRYSAPLRPQDVETSEQELVDLLQAALAPSFVLIRRLGAGGMGIVYLARDPALRRLVAVKVLSPERASDPDARSRFQREAEAVAAISHPNVVAVHSVGALANGIPYLVMQYVEGPSMAERLAAEGPLDLPTAKRILGQVASALEAAHRKGIVHRDIKAANILWDDVSGRALVTDFGIAAILEHEPDPDAARLTKTGMTVGTPRYMSPEQLLSEPVTARSDIYSLGFLGYELLTNEGPYEVTSPNQMVAAHLRDAPRPLSLMRPDVDPVLESLLASMLEKDAFARPAAEEIARRLQHGASVLLEWPPPGLEDLQGALGRPLGRLLGGAFGIAAPLAVFATTGSDNFLRAWPGVLLLPLVAASGVVSCLFALGDLIRIGRRATRAAQAGYGWGIIAEVLADTEKNTGALITGDGEYAALTVDQRNEIRRWRVLGISLKGAAAIWFLGGFVLGLPFAVRAGSPGLLAAWAMGIPIAMVAAARMLRRREDRLLDPIRARVRTHRAPMERLSHLAATWRDAFERNFPNVVGHTRGEVGRIALRVATAVSIAAFAVAGTIVAGGMLMIGVGGKMADQTRSGSFGNVQEKARKIERLRPLRASIDPAITPLQAGYALQSISAAYNPTAEPSSLETPVRFPIAAVKFPTVELTRLNSGDLVRRARLGKLTAEDLVTLRRAAAEPGEAEFRMIAHARLADWPDAMLVNPLPPGTTPLGIPIPRFGAIRSEGYAHIARAAVAAQAGKTAEAERDLREVIGAGFTLIEGNTVLENLIGILLVQAGRSELAGLYEATGRTEEARAISAASDPVRDETVVEIDPWRLQPEAKQAYVDGLIRDNTAIRGVRMEAVLMYEAYHPCSDLRQILFGPDVRHIKRMAEARKALVRSPGDERLIRVGEAALDGAADPAVSGIPLPLPYRPLLGFAKLTDAITGSKRMQSCVLPSVW